MMVDGTWTLVAATGAYAGWQARGRLYATVEPTTPPEITIVRDGSAEHGGAESEQAKEPLMRTLRRRLRPAPRPKQR